MPQLNKQQSSKVKKEDAERRKRVLSAQEKILSIKRLLLSIVETMIEKDVSKQWFLANCTKLCHADYNDVVQERSIEHLCGYPLCSNTIKQSLKQKYHISKVTNKVYDLTERKCFCSNQCYKASNYLKAQLSSIPLYMRKEEKIKVHLLSDCNNKGSAGEEIIFQHIISQDEIEKVSEEEQTSAKFCNMLNEEVKNCVDSLSDLQIKEHVFEKQFVFGDETSKKSKDSVCDDKNESNSDTEVDSDDSEDEKLFPNYDNLKVLPDKYMLKGEKLKKSVLIPPLQPDTTKSSPVKEISLDFALNAFKDWMTEGTMKYLLGEKYVYSIKADYLFERMTTNEPISSQKLSSIKDEYIKLCLKIDSLPDDDFSDSAEIDIMYDSKTSPVSKNMNDTTAKKAFKRRPKDKYSGKRKHVTFASKVKVLTEEKPEQYEAEKSIPLTEKEVSGETPAASSLDEPTFPLIDSVSQNALRRQVLTGKLKSMYFELLPVAGLHYTDVRKAIKGFVETLSLTPTNIIFKPKEWKIISLVLFRMLTKTVAKDLHNELQFMKMCENSFVSISIDITKLEKIVLDLLWEENIIKLNNSSSGKAEIDTVLHDE